MENFFAKKVSVIVSAKTAFLSNFFGIQFLGFILITTATIRQIQMLVLTNTDKTKVPSMLKSVLTINDFLEKTQQKTIITVSEN